MVCVYPRSHPTDPTIILAARGTFVAFKLLVSHRQFEKAIEPNVADLDNPAVSLLLMVAALRICLPLILRITTK